MAKTKPGKQHSADSRVSVGLQLVADSHLRLGEMIRAQNEILLIHQKSLCDLIDTLTETQTVLRQISGRGNKRPTVTTIGQADYAKARAAEETGEEVPGFRRS